MMKTANCRPLVLLVFCVLLNAPVLAQELEPVDSATCNMSDVEMFLQSSVLKQLEIETKKNRKWVKNYIKLKKMTKDGVIPKEYKKKYKATVKATFENGLSCDLAAKIKVSGDVEDHVSGAPPSITSLDVRLMDGNIDSAIRFKLFLPHTRNGDNEVFVASLLGQAGFISPRTYYVPSVFNGIKYRYLFQEKAAKEMLEFNLLREGPILEGDERALWNDRKIDGDGEMFDRLGMARLVNNNWANKGPVSLAISEQAVSLLNYAFLDYLYLLYPENYATLDEVLKRRLINGRYLNAGILANNNEFAHRKNQEFVAFMVALRATHGLRPHNRAFYFDPMYQYFLPVYYDGDSDILKRHDAGLDLQYGELNEDEVTGAKHALESLQKIDLSELYQKLLTSGVVIKEEKFKTVIDSIRRNLQTMAGTAPKILNVDRSQPYFSKYDHVDRFLVFRGDGQQQIVVCDFRLSVCNEEILGLEDYSLLLSGEYVNNKRQDYIYVSTDMNKYRQGTLLNSQSPLSFRSHTLDDNAILQLYGDMGFRLDREAKVIHLTQKNSIDRAVILGGALQGWEIRFKGSGNNPANQAQRFNEDLLTGCLTLLDITLSDVSLVMEDTPCEDGLNVVRGEGQITSLTVIDAMSDALDVDYSSLDFETINIEDAGNDCIDFSAGRYSVVESNLMRCGDKAVSVGEASTTTFSKISVTSAHTGIAVKDSSIADVRVADLNKVSICFSASRKKQEYWGGKLKLAEYRCPEGKNLEQVGSQIEVLQ